MKLSHKFLLPFVPILISLVFLFYYTLCIPNVPPLALVQDQIKESALSYKSVWDQGYLLNNEIIRKKIRDFEEGRVCQSLKTLDTKNRGYTEIIDRLLQQGFTCIVRPIMDNKKTIPPQYLKIGDKLTNNPYEQGVAYQEICQQMTQPECVIRIKRDGFPLNRRSNPHSTKAVLIDTEGDPGSYENEAFKIGWEGQALPKGPSRKFGLRKCPYGKNKDRCGQWVDAIMEETHPALKESSHSQN
jgi:hypothetical protein